MILLIKIEHRVNKLMNQCYILVNEWIWVSASNIAEKMAKRTTVVDVFPELLRKCGCQGRCVRQPVPHVVSIVYRFAQYVVGGGRHAAAV